MLFVSLILQSVFHLVTQVDTNIILSFLDKMSTKTKRYLCEWKAPIKLTRLSSIRLMLFTSSFSVYLTLYRSEWYFRKYFN